MSWEHVALRLAREDLGSHIWPPYSAQVARTRLCNLGRCLAAAGAEAQRLALARNP